jgi:phosphoribosylformimino-5-aminoimidazole carboxamide ribotide isomerase
MFRPCIDLHEGKVKQIVGGTLGDSGLRTNFVSEKSAAWFAELYRRDGLAGGHVIMLGPGNETAARSALAAFPDGLHLARRTRQKNRPGKIGSGFELPAAWRRLFCRHRSLAEIHGTGGQSGNAE